MFGYIWNHSFTARHHGDDVSSSEVADAENTAGDIIHCDGYCSQSWKPRWWHHLVMVIIFFYLISAPRWQQSAKRWRHPNMLCYHYSTEQLRPMTSAWSLRSPHRWEILTEQTEQTSLLYPHTPISRRYHCCIEVLSTGWWRHEQTDDT